MALRPLGQPQQERGDAFPRGLAAEQQHPFPRGVKLVERHLQQALADMRGADHLILERLLAEAAHEQVGRGDDVVGRAVAAGAAHKIRREEKPDRLGPAILHHLRQGGDAGHHRGHEIHPVAGPDQCLPGLEAAVILDFLKRQQLLGLAARADRPVADRTVATMRPKLDGLVDLHGLFDLRQGDGRFLFLNLRS